MNTTEFLTIASAIVPDREAVLFEDNVFTYETLLQRVNKLANGLESLGVGSGDRVGMLQVNCNQHIEAYFAAAKLDAIYVPLNFRAKEEELVFVLNDAEPKVIFAGQRYYSLLDNIRAQLTSVHHYVALENDTPDSGWISYEQLLTKSPDDERFPLGEEDDVTIIMFTAGTTGTPKGVMLSHASFSSYILANVSPADPEVEEKNILTVPLYHIAGMQAVMAAIYGGRTLIIQRQFDPVEWMQLVEQNSVDRAMMVPTMLKQLLDHPEFQNHNLSSLRVITYGAAPMPLEVVKRAIQAFPGTRFINAFGQTETASTITMLRPEDHVLDGTPEEIEKNLKRLSSIGKPLPDVEVRIVDEEGNYCPQGEVGEIVARGSRLMKGYWKMEEATQQTMRGGWLYTGDLGYFDEEGYIFLAGRSKDFIKRGGEMISPEEVERVLMSHPAVDDAAVIGIPDLDWGERVRAVVVIDEKADLPAEGDLIEHCRQRLSSYKKPESVVFVQELPRNPMGKILKRVLREQFGQTMEAP